MLLTWIAEVAIQSCKAVKEDLVDLFTAVVHGSAEVDLHRLLRLAC